MICFVLSGMFILGFSICEFVCEMSMKSQPDFSESASHSSTLGSRDFFWGGWAVIAAFGCYFCMYAFRKPFTAAGFADTQLWGVDYKTILVTAQVLGYTISKFVGIKIIAEMRPERRAITIVWLVAVALTALVLFGLVPRPWNLICLFFNGLPLGMVFGLVLGFLEGRRLTEALTAGLCASFILADGVTKSVGTWLLQVGVSEDWMPSVTGGIFLLPLGIFVGMLMRLPAPNDADIDARAQRFTMNRSERWQLLYRYALGIAMFVVIYLVVTVLRSIRADFQPEIWQGLGGTPDSGVFTRTEMWVALGVVLANGSTVLIRNNRWAFFVSLATCGVGFGLLVVALLGHEYRVISGFTFMVLVGLGLYLPYVAFHTTVFERLIAMTRERGNIGFLMYVVDAIGYLGYVGVMVSRNFVGVGGNMLDLLIATCWVTVTLSGICLVVGVCYFARLKV